MPVVIIGSGFIGCEIAASLRSLGHPVTVCSQESAPNVSRIGEQPAAAIAGWLRETGTELRLAAEVRSVGRHNDRLSVRTDTGTAEGGLVVMATGVSPRAELAVLAGLELEQRAIPADERMRTGLPDVLAAGDVVRAENAAAGRRLRVEHWGDALAQGESPAGRRRARARAGTRSPDSGRRSASTRSSTPAGATALTRCASNPTPPASPPGIGGATGSPRSSPTATTTTTTEGRELIAAGAPWS